MPRSSHLEPGCRAAADRDISPGCVISGEIGPRCESSRGHVPADRQRAAAAQARGLAFAVVKKFGDDNGGALTVQRPTRCCS